LPLLKIEEDEEEGVKLCNANNSGNLLIYKVAKHDRITAQYSEDGGADKWRNRFNGRANYIIFSRTLHQKVIMVHLVPKNKSNRDKDHGKRNGENSQCLASCNTI
jgi:hypothetical protein